MLLIDEHIDEGFGPADFLLEFADPNAIQVRADDVDGAFHFMFCEETRVLVEYVTLDEEHAVLPKPPECGGVLPDAPPDEVDEQKAALCEEFNPIRKELLVDVVRAPLRGDCCGKEDVIGVASEGVDEDFRGGWRKVFGHFETEDEIKAAIQSEGFFEIGDLDEVGTTLFAGLSQGPSTPRASVMPRSRAALIQVPMPQPTSRSEPAVMKSLMIPRISNAESRFWSSWAESCLAWSN